MSDVGEIFSSYKSNSEVVIVKLIREIFCECCTNWGGKYADFPFFELQLLKIIIIFFIGARQLIELNSPKKYWYGYFSLFKTRNENDEPVFPKMYISALYMQKMKQFINKIIYNKQSNFFCKSSLEMEICSRSIAPLRGVLFIFWTE